MNSIERLLDHFGIRSTPWVMRIYLVLLLTCIAMMVFAVFQTPTAATADHPAVKLMSLATDSFKLVLGAVIGGLSMAVQKEFGHKRSSPRTDGDENEDEANAG
jgi:hypothetical protein